MDLRDPDQDWPALIATALAAPGGASSDFDLNGDALRPKITLRPAAVLVGLIAGPTGPELVLTKRSSALRHHPGQIAFPGGKRDEEDTSLEACALREAHEEIGLPGAHVQLLGRLPSHETITAYEMTPVVGWISAEFDAKPEAGEVTEAFRVPLWHLGDPDRFRVEGRMFRGAKRYYYAVPWGPYYIWGATARILRGFADRLGR